MPREPRCIEARSTDPYTNLAVEACLLRSAAPGEPVLYLWQNERTVVIGRNQRASAECNVEQLERDGGHLARRRSGGGAVYHDLGNLNFTFVTTVQEYDQAAQTDIILSAVRALGIDAERTGRNDLVVEGNRKFSGHAYYHTGTGSSHHGTIMVAVDVEALGRYLTVSPLKLEAKGVRSVRSRVTNLAALRPGITIADLKDALRSAFADAMGRPVRNEGADVLDPAEVEAERRRFASRAWLFQGERTLGETHQARFGWGNARVDLTVESGTIRDLAIFSDALDTECLDDVPQLLTGANVSIEELEKRLLAGGLPKQLSTDIAHLITS